MSWKVEVPLEVADKIRAFRPPIDSHVVEAFRRIGASLQQYARPIPAGPHRGSLGCVIRVARPPMAYRFQLVIELSQDETTAYITHFDATRENPPPDGLSV